ncbi:hypothetical protein As57867_017372, partial [Aphanomyces stellatus]
VASVLCAPDVSRLIVTYQDGTLLPVLPLGPLEDLVNQLTTLRAPQTTYRPRHPPLPWRFAAAYRRHNIRLLDKLLDPWFTWYGPRVLPSVLTYKPHLRLAFLVYAACRGRVDILHVMRQDHHGTIEEALPHLSAIAASRGHLELVQWFLHQYHPPQEDIAVAFAYAAAANHMNMAVYLHQHVYPIPQTIMVLPEWTCQMDLVAARGHVEMLAYLGVYDLVSSCTTHAMNMASSQGHLEVVQLLHHQGRSCTRRAMAEAAGNGHLAIVQFLHEHREEGSLSSALDEAAAGGHLAIVEYLHGQWQDKSSRGRATAAMDRAAAGGHIDVIRFLHQHRGMTCSFDGVVNAVSANSVEILQYCRDHFPECTWYVNSNNRPLIGFMHGRGWNACRRSCRPDGPAFQLFIEIIGCREYAEDKYCVF